MIVGFDNDDTSIFESQLKFVRQSRVVHAMCGMCRLFQRRRSNDRLAKEQRLDFRRSTGVWDECRFPSR